MTMNQFFFIALSTLGLIQVVHNFSNCIQEKMLIHSMYYVVVLHSAYITDKPKAPQKKALYQDANCMLKRGFLLASILM